MAINLSIGDTQYIIQRAKTFNFLRNELAYVLATTYHETAHTMKPVREYGGERYLKSKKYYPYVGMGYVQLTWRANYIKAGKNLGLDFFQNPKKLLQKEYAVLVLLRGMRDGWFTGKGLSDYIDLQRSDFKGARRIVNGTDKASLIESHAKVYDNLLDKAGYGKSPPPPPDVEYVPPVEKSSWSIGMFVRLLKWLFSLR